jgi:hypothetical protein
MKWEKLNKKPWFLVMMILFLAITGAVITGKIWILFVVGALGIIIVSPFAHIRGLGRFLDKIS